MILLNKEERVKFATYLEQDADSTEGILIQMKKINSPESVIKKYTAEMLSARVIAKKLRDTENF